MVDKLPRKEDLLAQQNKGAEVIEPKVSVPAVDDVKKAEDSARIAENNAKRVKAENEVKLQERGYKSIEDGIAEIKRITEEANQALEFSRQKVQAVEDKLESIAEKEDKLTDMLSVLKSREKEAENKLAEAVGLNEEAEQLKAEVAGSINSLAEKTAYHNEHIEPCIKAIRKSIKALYSVWEAIENKDQYDKRELKEYIVNRLQYVGSITNRVDEYLKRVSKAEVNK